MSKITIAIDAMGGDKAPDMVVAGMAQARVLYPETRFLLFGDQACLNGLLDEYEALKPAVDIRHTDKSIAGDDKPSQALRRGRDSSMGLAIQAVKDGEADVAISAGNTGALMALAKFILRTMPGIDRPALISPVPTLKGESVVLDLGANVECDAGNLAQFAVMGSAYVRTVLGQSRPSVALLNVGVEELKGRESIREAAELLRQADHLPIEFTGFVEGDGIMAGEADVIVTDGFTGNVALKTLEGTAKLLGQLIERAFRSSRSSKLGYLLSRQGFQSLRDHLDPNNHNGGVFLGLNGLVVKSHGGANANGFATAISTAIDMSGNDLIRLIREDLENIPHLDETLDGGEPVQSSARAS